MLPGPVFFHELRTVARRRRSYALRTALGLFLLYLMIQSTNRWDTYAYQSETNREYTPGELALIGMNLFGSVIWLQGIVILLLTPAFVAGTIAEDRQRKVLSYLLASPLSGAEIVLGKLAARMVNLVVLVAVGLPVVSIALFLGGIDPADVWLWYGSSFSTLYLLAGVSIFVSTFSPRPRDAILRTYLIELVWLLLPLVEWLCGSAGGTLGRLTSEARPITEWVIGSCPIVLLCQSSVWLSGSGSGVVQAVTWLIGLQLLQGTLLLAWSTMRLRPVEQGSRLRGLCWLGSRRVSQPRRLFARRPCGDAPMIWKECSGTVSSPSLMRTVCLVCLTVAAVGGMGYWVYRMGIPAFQEVLDYGYGSTGTQAARDALSAGVRFLTACLYVLMALLLGAGAATGITMEREKDAWTSLTVTPLEGQEILT
ncbi:MAG: ABC transporter permease, partial [Isosphaeraceae bacterium]